MLLFFLKFCEFLSYFIPNRKKREHFRRVKLYDWRRKYNAIKKHIPGLKFYQVRVIKGGWNIGFIIKNRYVFKTRKYDDTQKTPNKTLREKRITDALAPYSPLQILHIDVVELDGYVFYKYDFIPGRNINTYSAKTITKHREIWGKQLADFINKIHYARPQEIKDLIDNEGDGWNHNDICNNVIINPKTMKIVGLVDWEYSGWGKLETELENCVIFSKKIRKSGIGQVIRDNVIKK